MSLQVNQLVGFGVGGDAPPASVSYTDYASGDPGSSTPSYSGLSFGAASDDRRIIVALNYSWIGVEITVTSATIGGVSAVVDAYVMGTYSTQKSHAAILSAAVPTGTTGTVALTLSGQPWGLTVAVFSATGLTGGTPTSTGTSSANPGSVASFAVQAGGIAVGSGGTYGSSGARTHVWANLTERVDVGQGAYLTGTAASDAFATATTATVTCTPSAAGSHALALAAYR